MKAVMYHYVRSDDSRQPNYYYLDETNFRRQLDHFQKEYDFVDREEFLAAIQRESDEVPSGIVLTFDDGLSDHYDFVLPELRRRGLWGIFYVPTGPYTDGVALNVHRIHNLVGSVPGEQLLEEVRGVIDEHMIPHERQTEYKNDTYAEHDDMEATKQVKRILNYFVAARYQTAVIDRTVRRLNVSTIDCGSFYMTPEELKKLQADGMLVGGHTVTHPVLSKLDVKNQRREIADCFDCLEELNDGLPVRTFCYPYGEEYTFDDNTVSILSNLGCRWSFKIESTDISHADIRERPQALPRYDCNEFPHGDASGSV